MHEKTKHLNIYVAKFKWFVSSGKVLKLKSFLITLHEIKILTIISNIYITKAYELTKMKIASLKLTSVHGNDFY